MNSGSSAFGTAVISEDWINNITSVDGVKVAVGIIQQSPCPLMVLWFLLLG